MEEKLDSDEKKRNGIFFTPQVIRKKMLNYLSETSPRAILEPSCGSGEFIADLTEFPNCQITGVELNPVVFEALRARFPVPSDGPTDAPTLAQGAQGLTLIYSDFLQLEFSAKFDAVIGNPPYRQLDTAEIQAFRQKYPNEIHGKTDIYLVFILRALELLRENGLLIFIIPTTILDTQSYVGVRRKLAALQVIDLIHLPENAWLNTKQKTVGLVVRNAPASAPSEFFYAPTPEILILQSRENIRALNKLLKGARRTIGERGFPVKTGDIVCTTAENRARLTADDTKPVLLHNSQIKAWKFAPVKPKHSKRECFIDCGPKSLISQPFIAVNRGNGNNGNLRFECALIDPRDYPNGITTENHIYKIYDNGADQLNALFQSLQRVETRQFISLVCGSGTLTKKLIEIIPMFV